MKALASAPFSVLLPVFMALVALGAAGCSSGNVQVSGSASASGAAPSGQPSRSQSGGAGPGGKGGPGSALKIFFERILADDGQPQSVISVSFLPQGSSGSAPFGAALRVPQDFSANPIFVPGATQVTYLRSTGIGADSLVSTSLSSWQTQPLFAFPAPVAGFALSGAQKLLAWAGVDGTLSVASLGETAPAVQALRLDGFRAKSVAWNSAGTRLLMRTDADAWVFAQAGPHAGWQQEEVFRGVTAAAFSPEGDELAIVSQGDRMLRVAKLGTGAATPPLAAEQGPLDSSELYDFGWTRAQGLSYWVRLTGGVQEIRVLAVAGAEGKGTEKTLARLSVPAAIRGGVICPTWSEDGATLYYSDFVDGEYVIERLGAAEALKGGRPTVFAQPPAADEGYVCPQSE